MTGGVAHRPPGRLVALLTVTLLWPGAACSEGSETAGPEPGLEGARAALAQRVATAEAAGSGVVPGADGWIFFAPELRHLAVGRFWGERAAAVSRAPRSEQADPLPAILDFQRQLAELEIDLLFVPVPAKAALYPDRLGLPGFAGEGAPRLDEADREFLVALEAQGVEVLDLVPHFRTARAAGGEELYCRQDTHWSPRGAAVAAGAIAERLAGRSYFDGHTRRALHPVSREIAIEGDLWREMPEPRPPREVLRVTGLAAAAGHPGYPAVDRASPVLLLGDSHVLVFHAGGELHATGGGLPAALALELAHPVDVLGVRGSGATPSRVNLLRRGDGLAGKRVVVWVLSVREYTQGQGWGLVPVTRLTVGAGARGRTNE